MNEVIDKIDMKNKSKKQTKSDVTTLNWFEKLPLHWRLLHYYIGGIITGLLLHYIK